MALREFVAELVSSHGTNDPFLICSNLGIAVEFMDIENVRGFAMVILDDPVIFLSNRLQGFNKKYVLAHELGHILLHDIPEVHFSKKHTLQKVGKVEEEANAFASLLLLDEATGSFLTGGMLLEKEVAKELKEANYQHSFKKI